jgi:hypothetical protein
MILITTSFIEYQSNYAAIIVIVGIPPNSVTLTKKNTNIIITNITSNAETFASTSVKLSFILFGKVAVSVKSPQIV